MLDKAGLPTPQNLAFLKTLNHPNFVPEVNAAGLEINSPVFDINKNTLRNIQHSFESLWGFCRKQAQANDCDLLMSGILPSATDAHITEAFRTQKTRYDDIEHAFLSQDKEHAFHLDIKGKEQLKKTIPSLAINGLTGSFQMHMRIPATSYVRHYNTSMAIAGPVLACATNSPFLLGKQLWEETRIASFEQMMTLHHPFGEFKCANFGEGYLESSWLEQFSANYYNYPRLLRASNSAQTDCYAHTKHQNSVTFRWSRAVLDGASDELPHLRIEFRPLPAGPSLVDMVANAAFYVGLMQHYSNNNHDFTQFLSFENARNNFYCAAKHGLDATLLWPGKGATPVKQIIIDELLPAANNGLTALGFNEEDVAYYLDIIEKRTSSGVNGSAWQRAFMSNPKVCFTDLSKALCKHQESGMPVHTWPQGA